MAILSYFLWIGVVFCYYVSAKGHSSPVIEIIDILNLTELGSGILKGYGLERPHVIRVFVPFPEGTGLEEARIIEQRLNSEPLEHYHIEEIDGRLYLHVKPEEDFSKYLKLKNKLGVSFN